MCDVFIGMQTVGLPKKMFTYEFGESMIGIAGSLGSAVQVWLISEGL